MTTTAYTSWSAIGYEAFYSDHTGSPVVEDFIANYERTYADRRRRAVAPEMDRAWFWYRVGFRRAKQCEKRLSEKYGK